MPSSRRYAIRRSVDVGAQLDRRVNKVTHRIAVARSAKTGRCPFPTNHPATRWRPCTGRWSQKPPHRARYAERAYRFSTRPSAKPACGRPAARLATLATAAATAWAQRSSPPEGWPSTTWRSQGSTRSAHTASRCSPCKRWCRSVVRAFPTSSWPSAAARPDKACAPWACGRGSIAQGALRAGSHRVREQPRWPRQGSLVASQAGQGGTGLPDPRARPFSPARAARAGRPRRRTRLAAPSGRQPALPRTT